MDMNHLFQIRLLTLFFSVFALLSFALPAQSADDEAAIAFFENKIRPVLVQKCYRCHGPEKQESDLRLDSYAAMLRGGATSPAVIPEDPEGSLLIHVIEYDDEELQMPPDQRLDEQVVQDFRTWITAGAAHPESKQTKANDSQGKSKVPTTEHWSFQPVANPAFPDVERQSWPQNSIDYFVLAELEEKQLDVTQPADQRTLMVRATLDLTGLPPTREQVEEFLADKNPGSYERLLDRLLASPAYGERWGRHWLDVARYADSNGLDENIAHGNAWRYRDYVIRALNHDKPYDQFLLEQVAGDLIAADEAEATLDSLVATGFLTLGPKVLAEGDETKMQMDIIDEQIDTIGRGLLGLTLGCARCHDHKFDPISTKDYYSLAGIFKSTKTMASFKRIAQWNEVEIWSKEEQDAYRAANEKVVAAEKQLADFLAKSNEEVKARVKLEGEPKQEDFAKHYTKATTKQVEVLTKSVNDLKSQRGDIPMAMGVIEGEVGDVNVHIRGSHLSLGAVAERTTPAVFTSIETPTISDNQSGRLQLANWLTDASHPLTSRVLVNRIWRWHFGRGLVESTDNFGLLGDFPSHPELLDHLAIGLVQRDWSIKELHKWIMLSATYQMGSNYNAQSAEQDPENVFLWRYPVRRVEAEVIRDRLLFASGLLDRSMGGSMLHVKNREFFFDHTSKDLTNYDSPRRSIYLPVVRNNLYDFFQLFDYTDASVALGNRSSSTVAPQALFMMNSPLVEEAACKLVERLPEGSAKSRIEAIYWHVLSRPPMGEESQRARKYLKQLNAQLAADGVDSTELEYKTWQALCQSVLATSEFMYLY